MTPDQITTTIIYLEEDLPHAVSKLIIRARGVLSCATIDSSAVVPEGMRVRGTLWWRTDGGQVRILSGTHSPAQLKQAILQAASGVQAPLEMEEEDLLAYMQEYRFNFVRSICRSTHDLILLTSLAPSGHTTCTYRQTGSGYHDFRVGGPVDWWPGEPVHLYMDLGGDVMSFYRRMQQFDVSRESLVTSCAALMDNMFCHEDTP
jgi:hypothetical protein